nr:hypothetical protein [Tanacetum cinerariifolium]
MASAIICLANNQKFNFSKYIFDNMVKNLEARVKFFMFLRFVQVFMNHQLGNMSHHKKIFVTLSLTKKVFANMKREGKGFSRIITPLFETMMVQASEKVGEGSEVLDLEKAKTAQAKEIADLKKRVKKLERKKKSKTSGLKRLWKGMMNEEGMFGVNYLGGDEVIVDATVGEEVEQSTKVAKKEVSTADPVTTAAQKLQTKEQEQLTDAEKTRLFMEFLEKRRKFFARKREIEKKNRPPTKAQQRSLMCTYLKNMDGWKPKNLKKKSFDEIQKLFDSIMKRVNTFVDMNTEIVEERSKKTQAEVTEGKLKRCLEIVPKDDDDVTIKATPLSSKSSTIVDYKIYKEGKKSYFKIIRADGNSQSYLTFGKMFKNFNKKDLEVLWSIVKKIFKKTKPVDDLDNLLFQILKTMFEHHAEDNIWRYQQGIVKVVNWKLLILVEFSVAGIQGYYCLQQKLMLSSSRDTTADRVTNARWIKTEIT